MWRVIPFAVLIALSVWGMVSPRTQWPVLWGWQYRFAQVPPAERDHYVRRLLLPPLVIGVIGAVVFLVAAL